MYAAALGEFGGEVSELGLFKRLSVFRTSLRLGFMFHSFSFHYSVGQLTKLPVDSSTGKKGRLL